MSLGHGSISMASEALPLESSSASAAMTSSGFSVPSAAWRA